jgi:membrane protein DedA with SNARE-associated domain
MLLGPIVALHVAGTLADWFAPALLARAPLLELFLNPRLRYLALVADRVGPVSFYSIAFVRLVLLDPVYYLLGLWYGDAAIAWMKRRFHTTGRVLDRMEQWFSRASTPILLLTPGGFFCLLAGATEMSAVRFAGLIVTGTVARLVLIHTLAGVFAGPLAAANHFIVQYQWWLVGASIAAAALRFAVRYLRRRLARRRQPRPVLALEPITVR